MTEAEVKQVARDGLCRDCNGHGTCQEVDEKTCRSFQEECGEIEKEGDDMPNDRETFYNFRAEDMP